MPVARPDGSSVKNRLRGCRRSCAMVCALRVMALLLRSERLEGGEANNCGGIVCDVYEFVPVGGS